MKANITETDSRLTVSVYNDDGSFVERRVFKKDLADCGFNARKSAEAYGDSFFPKVAPCLFPKGLDLTERV